MTPGERYLKQFFETIEVKYLRASSKGWTNISMVLDVRDQLSKRSRLGDKRGYSVEENLLVGEVHVYELPAMIHHIETTWPNAPTLGWLKKEPWSDEEFPVVVLTENSENGKLQWSSFGVIKPKP